MVKRIIFISLVLVLILSGSVLAESTGWNSPNTIINTPIGTNVDWSNPSNAGTEDGSVATTTLNAGTSDYLNATNFGLGVPTGSTIDGIEVQVTKKDTIGEAMDYQVRIVKGGVIGSTDRAFDGSWNSSYANYTYGSSTDLWGETWTADEVNDANFGFAFSATHVIPVTNIPSVDHIKIKVYYTSSNVIVKGGELLTNNNVTSSNWFVGLFNWVLDSFAQVYFSFDGSTLSFNETKLNETIDSRVENSFDQELNMNSSVEFKNMTIVDKVCMFNSNCSVWMVYNGSTMIMGVNR